MKWFYNLKTSTKLISAFVIIALIQLIVSLFSLSNMEKLNHHVTSIYNDSLKPIADMSETRELIYLLNLNSRDLYLYETNTERQAVIKNIEEIQAQIDDQLKKYESGTLTKEQKEILEEFHTIWDNYKKSLGEAGKFVSDGRLPEYLNVLNSDLRIYQSHIDRMLGELVAIDTDKAKKQHQQSDEMYTYAQMVTIFNIIVTFLISIGLGLWIARLIAKPLAKVVQLVDKVARGDLTETTDVRTKDEIGLLAGAVNHMVRNLKATIQNILSAAENLSAAAGQVSASTEEIATSSTNQANAAQTMNELFKELSEAIHSVAQNSEQAAHISNETIKIAQEGETVVLSAVEGANLVSTQMSRLEEDSRRIGDIIKVIDDISDQTNLLALNAAIEAARAGEQGRGFAVVADEVRKLAERSNEATKQIAAIIKKMQEGIIESVHSVEEGVSYTQKSGEAFEHIIKMINETGNKVTEIAGASEEQDAQSAEVLTFIESISAATEEATASSEQTASTAQALTDLAEELNQSVSAFKLN